MTLLAMVSRLVVGSAAGLFLFIVLAGGELILYYLSSSLSLLSFYILDYPKIGKHLNPREISVGLFQGR